MYDTTKLVVYVDTIYSAKQLDRIEATYIDTLEKTNEQLALWSNPYGIFIAVLGVLFAILAIGFAVVLFRQSRDYKEQVNKLVEDYLVSSSEKINQIIKELNDLKDEQVKELANQLKNATDETLKEALSQTMKLKKESLIPTYNLGSFLDKRRKRRKTGVLRDLQEQALKNMYGGTNSPGSST